METLHITNFLTIAQADICLNRFNVFIGPQARGKSIIVKLIYFFKREVGKALIDNVISGKNKRNLTVTLAAKFEAIFPKVYWGTQEFSMSYTHNCLDVRLVGTKTGASKVNLSITYSESLLKLHGDLKRHCQIVVKETQGKMDKAIAGLPRQASLFGEERMIISHILNFARTLEYDVFFEPQVFIPASRTFFANLQKNIFSFLASNIEIDPFLKEFGSVYENSKRFYKGKFVFGKDDDLVHKEIDRLVESIIAGRYLQENEQDWIIDSSRKINLANASSGQQEALPMLLALKAMSFSSGKPSQGFYIEEPEAHLFPASQKLVVSLLTMLANTTNHQFFITTHSPYILTALNNCILAASAHATASAEQQETIAKLMPQHYHLPFANVGAWTVNESGIVESIRDEEAQLIGASLLDTVSQEFEGVSNALLDIMYGA